MNYLVRISNHNKKYTNEAHTGKKYETTSQTSK